MCVRHRIRISRGGRPPRMAAADKTLIRTCVAETLRREGMKYACEVQVLYMCDDEIRGINNSERGVNKPTDVLSFPMFEFAFGDVPSFEPESGSIFLGDICISLERAKAQAGEFGHSFQRELGYLAVHSTLHLLGYDHIREDYARAMRQKEEMVMDRLGLAR